MNATRGYFYTSDEQALHDFISHLGEDAPKLRYVNELCGTCNGEGTQALHGYVLNEDQTSDPEFMEDYFEGRYDTACEECRGNKVVKVPDLASWPEDLQKQWKRWLRDTHNANAESLAEMRYGC